MRQTITQAGEIAAVRLPKNIWGQVPLDQDCYFRKTFTLNENVEKAVLRIFVDTGYELFVNDRFVGAVDEWINIRDYDVTPFLIGGRNVIAVKGVNHGGHRGFAFELRAFLPNGKTRTVVSGEDWMTLPMERWGWKSVTYDDSQWSKARVLDMSQSGDEQWKDRPGDNPSKIIPCQTSSLFLQGETPKCVQSPLYTRKPEAFPTPSAVMDIVGSDYLANLAAFPSPVVYPVEVSEEEPGNGTIKNSVGLLQVDSGDTCIHAQAPFGGPSLTLDFSGEIIGYLRLKIASDSSISFKLIFGEILNDCHHLPPTESLLRKMLVEEVHLSAGSREWESRTRQGFRFVRIEFKDSISQIHLESVSVKTSLYPVAYQGYFSCSDPMLNRIWAAGRKTLHLCMQEYYLDGIKRDRFLWVADARLEALINYYAFGDQDLFRFSWEAYAATQYLNGGIPSVLGEGGPILWDYVAWWVIAFGDYYQHTGDVEFLRKLKSNLLRATDWLIGKSGKDGLIDVPENKTENWMCVLNKKAGKELTMNHLFYRALHATALIMNALGEHSLSEHYTTLASQTKAAFNALPSSPGVDAFAPQFDHMPSGSIDCFEIIENHFANNRPQQALEFIRKNWSRMLETGVDTLWEAPTPNPNLRVDEVGAPFDPTSRCHGWTAGPTYALLSGVVGIKPTTPGFNTFEIRPQLANLTFAKGVVPTPHGSIAVSIERKDICYHVKVLVPENTQATLYMRSGDPAENAITASYQAEIHSDRYEAGHSVFTLCSGQYHLQLPLTEETAQMVSI